MYYGIENLKLIAILQSKTPSRTACKPGKWILLEYSLLGHVSPASGDFFVSLVGWLLLQILRRVRKHKVQLDVFEVKVCPGGGHLPGSFWVWWCGACPSNWRDGTPLFKQNCDNNVCNFILLCVCVCLSKRQIEKEKGSVCFCAPEKHSLLGHLFRKKS